MKTPESTPTYKQIEDQYQRGHRDPTVLVERSNHKITTGKYLGLSPNYPGYYEISVDSGRGLRYASTDQLTDKHQENLAEKLAGDPLKRELGAVAINQPNPGAAHGGFYDHHGRWIPGYNEERLVEPLEHQDIRGGKEIVYAKVAIREWVARLELALKDPQQYYFRTIARNASSGLRGLAVDLVKVEPRLSQELTEISRALWVNGNPQLDISGSDRKNVTDANEALKSLLEQIT